MKRIFAPDCWLLSIPLNIRNLFLRLQLTMILLFILARGMSGIFGISIPAEYGQWFGQIYQLYLDNQEVITNARKAYTAYKAVSNAVDALEGLNEGEREEFTNRWRRNMRVLLETQIWFEVDEAVWQGSNGAIEQILIEVLGLTFDDEGAVAIDPRFIDFFAVGVAADRTYWENIFLDASAPKNFPKWFITNDAYDRVSQTYLENQPRFSFNNFQVSLQTHMRYRLLERVASDPLRFLTCREDYQTCYNPFNFAGSSGDGTSYSWEEMLKNMYRKDIPLHDPNPLPGELDMEGSLIVNYDRYLHRRVCSVVWLGMGRELKDKLKQVHASFTRKCNEITATIQDIENLVRFLEDVITPLGDWDVANDGGSAAIYATALDLVAGGAADEQATKQSYFEGAINKKIKVALQRSREVKSRLNEGNALFENLLKQIVAAGKIPKSDSVTSVVKTNFGALGGSMLKTEVPPHNYAGGNDAFYRMTQSICANLGGD